MLPCLLRSPNIFRLDFLAKYIEPDHCSPGVPVGEDGLLRKEGEHHHVGRSGYPGLQQGDSVTFCSCLSIRNTYYVTD
jgi:hypothetical protein